MEMKNIYLANNHFSERSRWCRTKIWIELWGNRGKCREMAEPKLLHFCVMHSNASHRLDCGGFSFYIIILFHHSASFSMAHHRRSLFCVTRNKVHFGSSNSLVFTALCSLPNDHFNQMNFNLRFCMCFFPVFCVSAHCLLLNDREKTRSTMKEKKKTRWHFTQWWVILSRAIYDFFFVFNIGNCTCCYA